MQIFYASRDGQSRKIATHIAGRLAARGITATPTDLGTAPPTAADLARMPFVVAIMSIRYGKHLPEGLRFVETFKSLERPPALALASVNLTARKDGKDTAEGNVYLRKLIERNGLKPALAAAFAGRLDYPRYGLFDKTMIRFIMLITGGPTDPTSVVEFTRWDRVDTFAEQIAGILAAGPDAKAG